MPEPLTTLTETEPTIDPVTGKPPVAADPARAEREARLESDANAHRSFKGRLKQAGIDKLSDTELAELVVLGRTAKLAEGKDPEPNDPKDPKPSGKMVPETELKAAVERERVASRAAKAEETKALEAERDSYRALYLSVSAKTELSSLLGEDGFEDFNTSLVIDHALLSPKVPFVIELDEEASKSAGKPVLIVLDRANRNQEYRDPQSRNFLTPREALAALPRFASYVKHVILPGGTKAGITSAPSRIGKGDPKNATAEQKVGLLFAGLK